MIAAVRAANARVREMEDANQWVGTHFRFPKFRDYAEGTAWPRVDEADDVTDYGHLFAMKTKTKPWSSIGFRDVPEFAEYLDYVVGNEDLSRRVHHGLMPIANEERYTTILAALYVTRLLDRARHLGGEEPSGELLRDLYLELEPDLIEIDRPVEILVPVLLVHFDSPGRVEIAPGVSLEEMSPATHSARALTKYLHSDVNPRVAQAATHALVLDGYVLGDDYERNINRESYYPTARIDGFFRALDLVHQTETGYAQIIVRPLGWASDWKADLEPLMNAVTVRNYPPRFEAAGWNTRGSTFPADLLPKVGNTFEALMKAGDSVKMASRRVGSSVLRTRDDDRVIDLCIGLEALFSGKQTTEVVHRLAMRVAAVVSTSQHNLGLSASEIFTATKRIYDYRSRLVHGDARADQKRKFTTGDGTEHDCVDLAGRVLRVGVAALLDRPDFTDPDRVDHELILGGLGGARPGADESIDGSGSGSV